MQRREEPERPKSTPAQRLISLLDRDSGDPLTMTELRERGIPAPGHALYELELAGFRLERVYRRGASGRATLACRLGGRGADHDA